MSDDSNDNDYFYNASVPAAYIFSALFGICLLLHIGLAFKHRAVYMLCMIVGVGLEFIGYITRVISIKHPDPEWSIIVSSVGLIVAPAFMAAQSYMIVGRIMAFVGSEYSYLKHTRITKIFVAADIFAILTQSTGGAILGGANGDISQMKLAQKVLLAGLALQVITFGIFLFVAVVYDVRSRRSPALYPFKLEMRRISHLWNAFYITGVLITLRSIYRTIEFAGISFTAGNDNPQGYVITHEWVFYVFDAVPIFFSVVLLAICYPARYLPAKKGLRLDGTYEEQPGRRRFCCCGARQPPRVPRNEVINMARV